MLEAQREQRFLDVRPACVREAMWEFAWSAVHFLT